MVHLGGVAATDGAWVEGWAGATPFSPRSQGRCVLLRLALSAGLQPAVEPGEHLLAHFGGDRVADLGVEEAAEPLGCAGGVVDAADLPLDGADAVRGRAGVELARQG